MTGAADEEGHGRQAASTYLTPSHASHGFFEQKAFPIRRPNG